MGYLKPIIAPRIPNALSFAEGSLETPKGRVSVSWQQTETEITFEIELPEGLSCNFVWNKEKRPLKHGVNRFTLAK